MKEIGIFYGSTTGTTAEISKQIARALGVADEDVRNVAEVAPSALGEYKNLVFGTSTWGNGDLQEDWEDFIDGVAALDLKGKKIALFGCGDETMGDTFCAGVGKLYDRLQETGAEFIGDYDLVGYEITDTPARKDGKIVGLLLDEVNHPEATKLRIAGWVTEILKQGIK